MNTTAGLVCSATPTNASLRSLTDFATGTVTCGATAAGVDVAVDSRASPFLGRPNVDANANPNTKAIATRVPNFNQSRVRTDMRRHPMR